MSTYNLDIFPTDETLKQFPNIRSLILNEHIQQAFTVREKQAALAKSRYHFLGRIGISLIAIAAIYSAAEGLVLSDYEPPHIWGQLAAAGAVVGIAIQLYLLVSRQKHHWLLNRFAAERLRSIKFQAFMNACAAHNAAEIEAVTSAFCTDAIRALEDELSHATSALEKFSPSRALRRTTEEFVHDSSLTREIRDAYLQLRTDFQRKFAVSESQLIEERSKSTRSSSDSIYLLGAVLVSAALIIKLEWFGTPTIGHWIDFAALALFVISLSLAVFENASIDEDSHSRYEVYAQDLADLMVSHGVHHEHFGDLVRQTELLALRELADFSRAATRITYRV